MIPAIAGAGICLVLQMTWILSFLFLVPLGFLAFRYGNHVLWTAFLFMALAKFLVSLLAQTGLWDFAYFAAIAGIFSWIISPPQFLAFNMSGSSRMIAGSCLGALLFTWIYLQVTASEEFSIMMAGMINNFFSRSPDENTVGNATAENSMEFILLLMQTVMLRGGSFISSVFLLFSSRQISINIARLVGRERGTSVFMGFHVHPAGIWVLPVALFMLIFARVTGFETPEIILWNVLVICVMLYLAQGFGILQFLIVKRSLPPFFRLVFVVLFFVFIFSPGLSAVLLIGLILLGMAENWVPFRAQKTKGPPSTPGAGNAEN